jgi:hypothetical protein
MVKLNKQYHNTCHNHILDKIFKGVGFFTIEVMYQSRMENRVECNTPPIIIINLEMKIIPQI